MRVCVVCSVVYWLAGWTFHVKLKLRLEMGMEMGGPAGRVYWVYVIYIEMRVCANRVKEGDGRECSIEYDSEGVHGYG